MSCARGSARRGAAGRALLALGLVGAAGCYSVGFVPEGGASTIAVPVFGNQTLRRDLELSLTRHVRREVLEGTPLQLGAETDPGQRVLRGAIVAVREGVLVAGPAEEVLEASLTITVSFGVYRDGRLVLGEDRDGDGAPDAEITLEGLAEFSQPRGETRDTAAEEALRDLAEMIVARLSDRGDDRFEPNDEPARAVEVPLGRQVALRQRDEDWFRLRVPADQALLATLYYDGAEELVLRAAGSDGQWLPDARAADGGRILRLDAIPREREVLLRVSGPDDGRAYQLLLRLR